MQIFSSSPRKSSVVLVDANLLFVESLKAALSPYFEVKGFSDTGRAMAAMIDSPPDVIVVNERVSPWGVFKLIGEIQNRPILNRAGLICVSENALSNFFPLMRDKGITDAFEKPIPLKELIAAITRLSGQRVEASWQKIEPVQRSALVKTVSAFNSITDLVIQGASLPYGQVRDSCEPLVAAVRNNQYKDILTGVQRHDNYSYVHSLRVATFLSLFGHKIGIKGEDLGVLATGGLVHDIGKMTIPFEVLNKPGKLEGAEWDIMKSHVSRTLDFLNKTPDIPHAVIVIASQHHEKLNGTGYPNGLSGNQLNDLARMATIVDIFGALTDRRVYKDPMTPENALALMAKMSDEVDQHFLALFSEMLLEATSLPEAA
ncbi:MAG: HD domain-containing protein [Rhodospirillales bacterium]|nr:MAG: HD domain-containing protein [Rhodospirillales bacterium]